MRTTTVCNSTVAASPSRATARKTARAGTLANEREPLFASGRGKTTKRREEASLCYCDGISCAQEKMLKKMEYATLVRHMGVHGAKHALSSCKRSTFVHTLWVLILIALPATAVFAPRNRQELQGRGDGSSGVSACIGACDKYLLRGGTGWEYCEGGAWASGTGNPCNYVAYDNLEFWDVSKVNNMRMSKIRQLTSPFSIKLLLMLSADSYGLINSLTIIHAHHHHHHHYHHHAHAHLQSLRMLINSQLQLDLGT